MTKIQMHRHMHTSTHMYHTLRAVEMKKTSVSSEKRKVFKENLN